MKKKKSAPGVGGRYGESEGELSYHKSWSEAKGIWQDGQSDQDRGKKKKELVRSRRRLQTLVASSDGKGEEEKQAGELGKLGFMKATRILKAEGDPVS